MATGLWAILWCRGLGRRWGKRRWIRWGAMKAYIDILHVLCGKPMGKAMKIQDKSTFWDLGWTFEVFFVNKIIANGDKKMVRWKLGETGRLFLQCWTVGVQKWSFSGLFLRTVFSESYSSKYFLFSKIVGWITLFGSFHLFWLLHSQGFWCRIHCVWSCHEAAAGLESDTAGQLGHQGSRYP
jgi:hypothetical protein